MDPNPWEGVGLPRQFQPGPLGWQFGKVQANGPNGPQTLHLLIIDAANGRLAFSFDPDAFRRLAEQIIEQVSGLSVVAALPANGSVPR